MLVAKCMSTNQERNQSIQAQIAMRNSLQTTKAKQIDLNIETQIRRRCRERPGCVVCMIRRKKVAWGTMASWTEVENANGIAESGQGMR